MTDSPESGQSRKKEGLTKVATFANEARAYLLDTLRDCGNEVGKDHARAVCAIPELAYRVMSGDLQGRFRVGLSCGMGKTTAVLATLRAIHRMGLPSRVAVACSKVEELCELKRALMRDVGIPGELIGLMHSYIHSPQHAFNQHGGYASEPSEGHDRQFLLVTHANVQSGCERSWMTDRDVVIFDESLIVGEAHTLTLLSESGSCVVGDWGNLRARAESYGYLIPCVQWFDGLVARLRAAVAGHTQTEVRTIQLTPPDNEVTAGFKRLKLFASETVDSLSKLLELAERATELRVYTANASQSLLSYRVTVPDSLRNVIVLDASDPIRELVHHDPRMRRAEDVLDSLRQFRDVPGGLSSIKQHNRVKVYVASDAGGRGAMRTAFKQSDGNAEPWAIEKLVRLIKSKPTESFLIFTFKDKDKIAFARTIIRALEKAGISYPDISEHGTGRLNIQTWGRETGTNQYSHCQNVILLGVIWQAEEAIASRYLGQVDDVKATGMAGEVRELLRSECAHSIYQAINRACMRQVDVVEGMSQAKPCSVYLWHSDKDIEARLAPVLHGVPPWQPWREEGESMDARDVGRLIAAELTKLQQEGYTFTSLRSLKQKVASTCPSKTWQRARTFALATLTQWQVKGGSLVIAQSPFPAGA